MQTTRRGRPGYAQQGVLAVAVAAFNEHGYDATSIGMLAERLGLSKSAIYHHFGSKDEMLDRALDSALGGLEAVVDAPLPDSGGAADAVARLEHVLRGAVEALREQLPAVTPLRSDIDAAVVARLTFGMINSIVEWYRPGGREGADRLADDVVAIALDGLRHP